MDRHLDQLARAEIIEDQITGHVDHSRVLDGRHSQSLVVGDLQWPTDFHQDWLASRVSESPAVVGLDAEVQDTAHAGQLVRRGRHSMPLQERRRDAADEAVGADPPGDDANGTELAHAHGQTLCGRQGASVEMVNIRVGPAGRPQLICVFELSTHRAAHE